jgi:hypothetical protein
MYCSVKNASSVIYNKNYHGKKFYRAAQRGVFPGQASLSDNKFKILFLKNIFISIFPLEYIHKKTFFGSNLI